MLKERAALQLQTDQSQNSATVAEGTPRRFRSMAVGTSDDNNSVPETMVEKIYSSSTEMRLQGKDDSPRRKLKMRQGRSDKVQTDLVIPNDLIQKRYSDSCSNLSVMVTVTRKRSEQGQGDGRDLDCGRMTSTLLEEDVNDGSGETWGTREEKGRGVEEGERRREKMHRERVGWMRQSVEERRETPKMVPFTCQTEEDLGEREDR